jgi:sec-independent protein translocase protein TatB
MELFGVGIGEAGLVLLITLLVVGPERFPQIAREGGKYYRMARRFTAEVTGDLRTALNELENEVNEQTGDLKAVREISEDVRAGVAESATDMDSISRATSQAASGEPAPNAPSSVDPFARVMSAYTDYHAPSTSTPTEAPAQAAPDAEGDEMSRQAEEAFADYRRTEARSAEATPPPTPAPYSPQSIVGVNPFASADPPAAPATVPVASADPTESVETPANSEARAATSTSASATPAPSSTRAPDA